MQTATWLQLRAQQTVCLVSEIEIFLRKLQRHPLFSKGKFIAKVKDQTLFVFKFKPFVNKENIEAQQRIVKKTKTKVKTPKTHEAEFLEALIKCLSLPYEQIRGVPLGEDVKLGESPSPPRNELGLMF